MKKKKNQNDTARTNFLKIYPPGSKCKALRLGVHLILLYFIRMLFFYLDVGVDVGGGLFLSLNLFKIKWYILQT